MYAYYDVLIVDDDLQYSHIAVRCLQDNGFRTLHARTIGEADRILAQNPTLRLVIVDGLLPDGNGVDWLKRIRKAGFNGKAIFASSFWKGQSAFVEITREAQADKILHKPFSLSALLMQTERLIGKSDGHASEAPEMSGLVDEYCESLKTTGAEILKRTAEFLENVEDSGLRRKAYIAAHSLQGTAAAFGLTEIAEAARLLANALEQTEDDLLSSETKNATRALTLALNTPRASCSLPGTVAPDTVRLPRPTTDGARILLLDDNRFFVKRTSHLLGNAGFDVRSTIDPSTLLETLAAVRPELLLMDLVMPNHSGLELCRQIKAMPSWRHLPVLILTGQTGPETRIAVAEAGADDYLPKDISAKELVTRVSVRVHQARTQRDDRETDALTRLLNRAGFRRQFIQRLSEAGRTDAGDIVLCLLDIDHFKKVNDTHGHLKGDEVIRALSAILRRHLRLEDLHGRWGGEEFILCLQNQKIDEVFAVLERIRTAFGEKSAAVIGSNEAVTLSGGIALYPYDGGNLDKLLAVADKRLYAAKDAGRNTVIAGNRILYGTHFLQSTADSKASNAVAVKQIQ